MHKSANLRVRAFDLQRDFDYFAIYQYNVSAMKRALVVSLLLCVCGAVACKNSSTGSSSTSAASGPADSVQQKLQELAGSGAKDCGRVKSQEAAQVQPASDCAMKSAEAKQPFYVAYDLPGMTTAVAGNVQGALYSVQAQTDDSGAAKVDSSPCPAALRLAQSGRVTCFAAGSMGGMGMPSGANPHGGAGMPPATGQNPHGAMPPATGPNPHAAPAPSHAKPSTSKD